MELYAEYLHSRQNLIGFIKKRQNQIKNLPIRSEQNLYEREIYDIAKIQISLASGMKSDIEYSIMLMEKYLKPEQRVITPVVDRIQLATLVDKNSYGYNPDGEILFPSEVSEDGCGAVEVPNGVDLDIAKPIVKATTKRQRLVVVCYYFFGVRQNELADYLGITQEGIFKHLKLAHHNLREELKLLGIYNLNDIRSIKHVDLDVLTKGIESEFKSVMTKRRQNVSNRLKQYNLIFKDVVQNLYTGQFEYIAACSKGHKFEVSKLPSGALQYNSKCPKCYSSNKKNNKYNMVKELFAREGYQLTSNTYKDRHTMLAYTCPYGHIGYTTLHNFLMGRRCRSCFVESGRATYYSIENAYKNQNLWKNKTAYVYIIHLTDGDEDFYKIGISCNLKTRLAAIPYNCKIVKLYKTNLYDACFLERNLLRYHRKHNYKPNKQFGGDSECFAKILIKPSE